MKPSLALLSLLVGLTSLAYASPIPAPHHSELTPDFLGRNSDEFDDLVSRTRGQPSSSTGKEKVQYPDRYWRFSLPEGYINENGEKNRKFFRKDGGLRQAYHVAVAKYNKLAFAETETGIEYPMSFYMKFIRTGDMPTFEAMPLGIGPDKLPTEPRINVIYCRSAKGREHDARACQAKWQHELSAERFDPHQNRQGDNGWSGSRPGPSRQHYTGGVSSDYYRQPGGDEAVYYP